MFYIKLRLKNSENNYFFKVIISVLKRYLKDFSYLIFFFIFLYL